MNQSRLILLETHEATILLVAIEPSVDGAINSPGDSDHITSCCTNCTSHKPGPTAQSVGAHVEVETVISLVFATFTNGPFFVVLRPQKWPP